MRQKVSAVILAITLASAGHAQEIDGRMVRTFVVERHVISKDDYQRAVRGKDVRLASLGKSPRPHALYEIRGQGDVFTGWTQGQEVPYMSGKGLAYEFVGSVGEVQPGTRPDYRTLMMRDSRIVSFHRYRGENGRSLRVPIVRKSDVSIEFPMNGKERAQVYAIPRGKSKFEYRLVTVKEDASKRRVIRLLDQDGRP